MIDRRRPQPWTHIPVHEIITEDLLIIGERVVLLVGYCGGKVPTPLCQRFVRSPQHVQVTGSNTRLYRTRQD